MTYGTSDIVESSSSYDSDMILESDSAHPGHNLLRYVPRLFRFESGSGPLEATGLALDIYGRASVLMTGVYLGPALLTLATDAVKIRCGENDNKNLKYDYEYDSCVQDGRIYGMKPSSLLSNIAMISGLIGAIILPLFGAVVDHTPYRRQVGLASAIGLIVVKGLELIISSSTWFFISFLQTVAAVLFQIHICATYAYTSELSSNPAEQTKYNTYFNVVLFISTLAYLFEVVFLASLIGVDDIGTAKVSLVIAVLTASICFIPAWLLLFRNRPALNSVPDGSSLVASGFRQVIQTTRKIWFDHPALKWFMLAVMFNEAGSSALLQLSTTLMKVHLGMDAKEIGVAFLVLLACGLPGVKFGEFLALKYCPLTSLKLNCLSFILSLVSSVFVLSGPDSKCFIVLFAGVWGANVGWLHPVETTIFITVSQRGQESELMGMYIFCSHVLAWLPLTMFTILNESGVEMSIGVASLSCFFVIGLSFLVSLGSYEKAVESAKIHSKPLFTTNRGEMDDVGVSLRSMT